MIKYIKLIPLMLFPYAYMIWLFWLENLIPDNINMHAPEIYIGLTFVLTVISTVITAASKKTTAASAAKQNLIVKAVQIPAYIFHFLLALISPMASVWGIGFFIFAVIINLMTISLTGIFAIGCNIRVCRSGVISKGTAVFISVLSFVFCTDLIVAIVLFVTSKSYEKKALVQKESS
ncbi:MAG: hypothetical protein E7508_06725 [Ruminococcus sp.]|nr:hypothetical protein [Ruminococcus sp.]